MVHKTVNLANTMLFSVKNKEKNMISCVRNWAPSICEVMRISLQRRCKLVQDEEKQPKKKNKQNFCEIADGINNNNTIIIMIVSRNESYLKYIKPWQTKTHATHKTAKSIDTVSKMCPQSVKVRKNEEIYCIWLMAI